MLTLKLITEETDRVIRGLEKKHFKNAKEAIDEVLAVDKKRREAQQQLDKNLSEAKKMAAQIGGLMKEGKKAEADAVKAQVSEMKETNKQLEETMNQAQEEMTRLLCQIPNIPYDEVPSIWVLGFRPLVSPFISAREPVCSVPSSTSSSMKPARAATRRLCLLQS